MLLLRRVRRGCPSSRSHGWSPVPNPRYPNGCPPRTMWTTLSAIGVLALLATPSHAQQKVGFVARIAEKKGHFVDSTTRAELWRTGDLRVQVRRAAPLLYQDIVRLRERIVIDLSFRQPELETDVYLGSRQLADVGSYEILRDSVGSVGGLELVVKQGVMIVEHARGGLLAVAAGIRTRIFGTTVLFAVDADDAAGTVFVREGHIAFPDYGIDAPGGNRAWHLRRGQAPVELILTGPELRRWQQEVEYTTQSVWHRTPFWQTPKFLLPAAAVAGGIGCLAAGCFSAGDQGSQGGVVITIPE
jgi:hypothetical protein